MALRGGPAGVGDDRSTAEVLASLVINVQAMLAKEVELLGLELRRIVARRIAAIGVMLTVALFAVASLVLGAVTLAIWLESRFDEAWQAWASVAGGSLVLSILLLLLALRLLSRGWGPRRTRRQLSTTATWMRELRDEIGSRDRTQGKDGGDAR